MGARPSREEKAMSLSPETLRGLDRTVISILRSKTGFNWVVVKPEKKE